MKWYDGLKQLEKMSGKEMLLVYHKLKHIHNIDIDFKAYPITDETIVVFDEPKTGVFEIPDSSKPYNKDGWPQKLVDYTIIAESSLFYIYAFKAETTGLNGKGIKYTIEIGVHKSRLKKWKGNQLSLF